MADAAPTPDDAGAPPGRRRLLRTTLAGTALLAAGALGAGAGAALTHHLDTHLSPTDRVAPAPSPRASSSRAPTTPPAPASPSTTAPTPPGRRWSWTSSPTRA